MARYKENNNFIPKSQKQGFKAQKPTLKERLNKIFFWVIIGLFCLFSVGSICGILAYSKDCNTAYADSVVDFYSFQGSDIWLNSRYFSLETFDNDIVINDVSGSSYTVPAGLNVVDNITNTNSGLCNFKFLVQDAVYDGKVVTELVISNVYLWGNAANLNTLNNSFSVLNNPLDKYNVGNAGAGDVRFYLPNTLDYFYIPYCYLNPVTQRNTCRVLLRVFKSSLDFNCNIYKIEIGTGGVNNFGATIYEYASNDYRIKSISTSYNYIRYYDKNDNYIEFDIPCSSSSIALMDKRIYYTYSGQNDNVIYQNGYQDGYINGEQVGQDNGYQSGYQEGNKDGYNTGYNEGKNYGFEHASDYSFYNLIASVVDAPLSAVISLFNFEILGINFSSLFTGLLTLAVIIFVVRLVL